MINRDLKFFKVSFSQYVWNKCVEVAFGEDDESVNVRDSKNPEGPVLTFTPDEWDAFIKGVKQGEFDLRRKTEVASTRT